MKKLILTIASILWFFNSFSQQSSPTPSLTKQVYLTKSKKQKPAGWALFGFGTAMLVGGSAIAAGAADESWNGDGNETLKAGGVVVAVGLAAMLGSIPLFIASGRNKRKAATVSFNNMKIPQIKNSSLVYKPMPAVLLKFNL